MKYLVAALVIAGSVTAAEAMPVVASQSGQAAGLPVVKTAVVIKKTVVRRPPVHRRVVKKVIVR